MRVQVIKKVIAAMTILFVVIALMPEFAVQVNAAEKFYKPVKLKHNKTYRKWDFNGDRKKDKLKIKYIHYLSPKNKGGYMTRSYFMLNGKSKGKVHGGKAHYTKILPKGKKKYLAHEGVGTGKGNGISLYYYNKGKFCNAYGGKNRWLGESTLAWTKVYRYSKKTVKVRVSSGGYDRNLVDMDSKKTLSFMMGYGVKKNGKLKLKSRYCPVTGKSKVFRAKHTFFTDSAVGKNDGQGVIVCDGDKVNIKKMYAKKNNGGYKIMINVNGKNGWINSSDLEIYSDYYGWDEGLLY